MIFPPLVFDVGFPVPGDAGANALVYLSGDRLVGKERGRLLVGVQLAHIVTKQGHVGAVHIQRFGIHVADADGIGRAFDRLADPRERQVGLLEAVVRVGVRTVGDTLL